MNRLKILVVDDLWHENKNIFESFLSKEKYDVVFAKNGSDFRQCTIESFDAILLDINLDTWDMPLTEACRIINSKAPVILVSLKMVEKITLIRIQEAISTLTDLNVIQTFDLRLLEIGSTKEKAQTAKIFSMLIKIAISCSIKTSPFSVEKNSDINILHISDLQYGDPNTDDWSKYVENGIADYLIEKYPEIHFIVVTGDIAYSGRYDEYERAKYGLLRLVDGLWSSKSQNTKGRIILVPGNHDVDYRFNSVSFLKPIFSDDEVAIEFDSSMTIDKHAEEVNYGMLPFRKFAYDFTGDKRWITSNDLSWVQDQFRHLGLRFLILNSANSITCKTPKLAAINEDTTDSLANILFKSNNNPLFTIACSHHGPLDPEDDHNIEHIEDWPRLSNFLSQSKVNLWVHGHGHKRLIMPHPYGENTIDVVARYAEEIESNSKYFLESNEFVRIMAATTHLNGKLRPNNERKGFNVIKLKRENGATSSIEVLSYELADKRPQKIFNNPIKFVFQ